MTYTVTPFVVRPQTTSYWLSMIVGFLMVLVAYYVYNRAMRSAEHFAEETQAASGASSSQAAPTASYTETLPSTTGTPYFYYTTMSDKTKDGKAAIDLALARWYNYMDSQKYLVVMSPTPPTDVAQGILMMNRSLTTFERSADLGRAANDNNLGPFTLSFFLKFQSLPTPLLATPTGTDAAATPAASAPAAILPIKLFVAHAEDDNFLQLQVTQSTTADKVKIKALLGQSVIEWEVAQTVLLANGQYTTITLTFQPWSAEDGIATLYLGGAMEGAAKPVTSQGVATQIRLGMTSYKFNENMNLDGMLKSIMFYKSVLTAEQVKSMHEYMNREGTGVNRDLVLATQQKDALTNQVQSAQTNMESLKDALAQCQVAKAAAEKNAATTAEEARKTEIMDKWKILMQGGDNSFKPTSEYEKYSALLLSQFRSAKDAINAAAATSSSSAAATATDTATATATATASAASGGTSTTTGRFTIPYPTGADAVASKDPGVGNVTTPGTAGSKTNTKTKTTTASSTKSASNTDKADETGEADKGATDADKEFWKSIFMFLGGQTSAKTSTSDNLSKDAYTSLRESVNTDRTQENKPIAPVVQDPPKASSTTKTEPKSWWEKLTASLWTD